jgi:hypothetical protein
VFKLRFPNSTLLNKETKESGEEKAPGSKGKKRGMDLEWAKRGRLLAWWAIGHSMAAIKQGAERRSGVSGDASVAKNGMSGDHDATQWYEEKHRVSAYHLETWLQSRAPGLAIGQGDAVGWNRCRIISWCSTKKTCAEIA